VSAITIINHGPIITATNYWGSDLERAGKLFVSCNAGAVRVLVPRGHRQMIDECRSCRYVILSRGPWPSEGLPDAVELFFEDGTDSPFALHLSPEPFDLLPDEPPAGREWIITLWELKKGQPHKALERVCYWRRVPQLPWLKPLEGEE
jgi:hypothetical protein